jgi:hypothetical protein
VHAGVCFVVAVSQACVQGCFYLKVTGGVNPLLVIIYTTSKMYHLYKRGNKKSKKTKKRIKTTMTSLQPIFHIKSIFVVCSMGHQEKLS